MKAESLLFERHVVDLDAFVELRVWKVPLPVKGSRHELKYSLAYVERGICTLRFDNEAGKGDHKHVEEIETAYEFRSLDTLIANFWIEVERRRHR